MSPPNAISLCRGFFVWVGVVGDVHDVTTRRKWGKNG